MGTVRCLVCGAVLTSKHRHDFVMCDCSNQTFIDGGNDYIRCGGKDPTKIEVLKMDYDKHMTDLHKKPVSTQPQTPPRIGR